MKRLIIILLCLAFGGMLLMGQVEHKTLTKWVSTTLTDDDTMRIIIPVNRVDYNTNYVSFGFRLSYFKLTDTLSAADSCQAKVRSGLPATVREADAACTVWTKYVDIPIQGDTITWDGTSYFLSAMDIQAQIVGASNKHDEGIIPGCKVIEIMFNRAIIDTNASLADDSFKVWCGYGFE
jgi:hypothetical protein